MSKYTQQGQDITDVVDSPKSAGAGILAMSLLVIFVLLMCWFIAFPTDKEIFAKINAPASNPRGQNISTTIIICGVILAGGFALLALPTLISGGYDTNVEGMNQDIAEHKTKEQSWRVMHSDVINAHRRDKGLPFIDRQSGREPFDQTKHPFEP